MANRSGPKEGDSSQRDLGRRVFSRGGVGSRAGSGSCSASRKSKEGVFQKSLAALLSRLRWYAHGVSTAASLAVHDTRRHDTRWHDTRREARWKHFRLWYGPQLHSGFKCNRLKQGMVNELTISESTAECRPLAAPQPC